MDSRGGAGCSGEGQGNQHVYPDVLEIAWDCLTFDIPKRGQETVHLYLHSSNIEENVQIQYAVQNTVWQDVLEAFQQFGINISHSASDSSVIVLKGEGSENLSSIEDILKIFREEIFIMLDIHKVPLGSKEGLTMLEHLKKEVPEVIRKSEAAVYYQESSKILFFIGGRTRFKKLLKELGIESTEAPELPKRSPISAGDIEVTFHELMCLKHLDFENHIKKKYNGLTVEYSHGQTPCVVSLKGTACSVKEEVRKFLKSIEKAPIDLNHSLCYQLLFDESRDHFPNENVNSYILSIFHAKHKRKMKFYVDREDNGRYFVCCLEKSGAGLVASIFKDSIVYSSGQMHCNTTWELAESLSKKGKLKYVRKENNFFEMCYTKDLADVVTTQLAEDAAAGETMTIPLPKMVISFLKSYGQHIIEYIQKHFKVQMYKIEDSFIVLKGEKLKLKESKKYLKAEISSVRKSVPVLMSEKELNSLTSDLNEEMDMNNCIWTIQHSKQEEQKLSSCEYLASWMDPIGQLKLTLVEGCPWFINFDLHIVLADQSMLPLESNCPNLPVWEDSIKTTSTIKGSRNLVVGEQTGIFDLKKSGFSSKKAAAIIVMTDLLTAPHIIDNKDLQNQVGQLLKEAESHHIRTVGMNSFIQGNLLKPEDIVESITEAVTEHSLSRNDRFVQECFICCSDKCEQTLNFLDKYFRKRKGYSRAVYSKDVQLIQDKETNREVKVCLASLHEIKADALVNTTRKNLQLNSGKVSSKILEKAGPNLQDECNKKYPNGISYGDVAVTRSYNMKDLGNIKYIFHIAVLEYESNRFRQSLISLVKKCLFQAEREGCFSVAFPALGVGGLNYPRRETVAAMFDAVDEFCSEAVKPKLKKIKMVVYPGDKKTCDAFENEEWRRSKKFNKDVPGFGRVQNFSAGPDALRVKVGQVSATIACTKDGKFSSFAVHVFFRADKNGYKVKSASEDVKSWNDHIYLYGVNTIRNMRNSLKECCSIFTEERVTEGVFHTNTGHSSRLSEREQVISIIDWLTQQKCGIFLQKVTILVIGAAEIQSAHYHIEKDRSGQIKYTSDDDERQKTGMTIELVGKTKELVETAEKSVIHILDKKKEGIKTSKSPVENKSVKNSDLDRTGNTAIKQAEAEINKGNSKQKDSDKIAAQINPGIVQYILSQDLWDTWKMKIWNKFQVEIMLLKHEAAQAEGQLNNILNFESYLENKFTNEEDTAKTGLTVQQWPNASALEEDYNNEEKNEAVNIQMTRSEYCTFLQLPACKVLLAGEKCFEMSYIEKKGCLQITCLDKDSKSILKDLEQTLAEIRADGKTIAADESSYKFIMSKTLIVVRKGNIMNENVVCCIIKAPSRLSCGYYGVLHDLAAAGGEQFRNACVSSGKDIMEEGECRLVNAASLSFTEQIMLVKLPYKPDASFENILLHCLSTADKAGISSVALPLLASGNCSMKKGVTSIGCCSNWYINAMRQFEKNCKSLKRIVFVDTSSDCIDHVQNVFGKHLDRLHTDFGQITRPKGLYMCMIQGKGMKIEESGVNIYVATGDLTSTCTDAFLCPVDQTFKSKEQYFKNIQMMASNHYRQNMSVEQDRQHTIGSVKKIACSGGSLSCNSIIHAVLPCTPHMSEDDKSTIARTIKNVFDVATECCVKSIAIPISKSDDELTQEMNIEVIENTIKSCQQKKASNVKAVHFITTDSECEMATIGQIFKLLDWGSIV